jgi:rhodanese-related sulfurtransferase
LILAKFVPGLSTIARPLAGTLHMDWRAFAVLDGVGSALWVGAAMWAGMLFQEQIGAVLLRIREFGPPAFVLACALIGAYLIHKWWERRRFDRTLSLARIDVRELRRLMQEPRAPIVVDLRSPLGRKQDPRMIPGALAMSPDEITTRLKELPPDREIVLYCACPREATAVVASRKLLALGYTRVRPLLGGLDAWMSSEAEPQIPVTLKTAAALPTELR